MKKKMTIIGLLIFVCVLFLGIGYANVSKSIDMTIDVHGSYKQENFKIGFLIDNFPGAFGTNVVDNSLNVLNWGGSSGSAGGEVKAENIILSEGNIVLATDATISLGSFDTIGEYLEIYIPIMNNSNDLRAKNITPEVITNFNSDCSNYYKLNTPTIVFYDTEEEDWIERNGDYILPYATINDAIKGYDNEDEWDNAVAFMKVRIDTIHTLDKDINAGTCSVKLRVTAEPVVNVD